MPRLLRTHYPGIIHHVVTRGVARQPIFLGEHERRRFMSELGGALARHGAALLSYCLMSNHLHLLMRSGDTPISTPLQEALGRYGSWFNHLHARVGHLFQGRYHAVLCGSDRQLVETVAYIHLNPVKAGMVPDPGRWRWSSHAELISGAHEWVDLRCLHESTGMQEAELKELYLGLLESKTEKSAPDALAAMLEQIAGRHGIGTEELWAGRRGSAYSRARLELIIRARAAGHSDADIARALRCSKAAVSLLAKKLRRV
ncbi:MAG: transposase [Elusimicrobiota bacterium]|nr:transposase [Elusimicrobiota bacterium]